MSSVAKPPFEDLGASITREWIDEGTIVIYTGKSPSRQSIDTLFADVRQVMSAADVENAPGFVYDVSHPDSGITPYASQQARQALMHRPELYGFVAIIVRQNFSGWAIKLFINSLQQTVRGAAKNLHVFYHREDGIKWLRVVRQQYAAMKKSTSDKNYGAARHDNQRN
ncbi:MAG TPA: hypothetical protein PLD47_07045 [Aggregatilineales bacterium]|nr:hypothetical protein [Anaerolineales bacterium]HRE47465.1 hypothetical protein [Aggregatilineales bacterium]